MRSFPVSIALKTNIKMIFLSKNIYVILLFNCFVKSDPIQQHDRTEVVISDHDGPLNEDVLKKMKEAEVVEFRDSIITSLGGPMVPTLPKLKKIVLIDCTIEVDVADVENMFKGATNLREIHVRHIESEKLKIDALRRTPIEVFVMTDNNIPKLPGNCFNETKLKKLELRRVQLKEIDENAFNGLENLEILDLGSNFLPGIPKSALAQLKHIKHIDLKGNIIQSIRADHIPELPHLESIDLMYNPMIEFNLDGIETVAPKLREINIRGAPISYKNLETLKSKHTNITLKT